ncbi:hypothetical protein RUND412_001046 [Rhizina undulata]
MSLPDHEGLSAEMASLRNSLATFAASPATFQLIHSTRSARKSITPTKELFVLDSSFNPPTKAHLNIALTSLRDASTSAAQCEEIGLLLLLAIQNADKAPKPASFEERVAMMTIFVSDILSGFPDKKPAIDIAVTKHARFLDKSSELAKHYPELKEQVYLTGYDTLIRILDTKYYPPAYNLEPLETVFRTNRIRCMFRLDDQWGGKREQEEYLSKIRDGSREAEGCKREWAEKIELVENEMEVAISSTKVREAVRQKDEKVLDGLLTKGVKKWVLERNLYYEQ